MRDKQHKLFIFIIETLTYATTQSSVVGTNTLGIGTYEELADYLNLLGRLSPTGKRWTANALEVWLARYLKQHPKSRDMLDREHIGSMDNTYLANTPAYHRETAFEEAAENFWWNNRWGGWQRVESDSN
jgi:hypothetical protein